MRLLIVEDEAITALQLQAMLAALGYEVCSIEATGEGAVDAAARYQPDLVLMDVRLAGKMDGIAAALTIRRDYGIPSLLVTAFTDAGTRKRAEEAEPLGVLVKPYTSRQVRTTLENLADSLPGDQG